MGRAIMNMAEINCCLKSILIFYIKSIKLLRSNFLPRKISPFPPGIGCFFNLWVTKDLEAIVIPV